MTVVPYKKIRLNTRLSRDEFLSRMKEHAEFSKTRSFFSALSDDFLLKLKFRGNNRIEIVRRFGAQRFRIIFSWSEREPDIYMTIGPGSRFVIWSFVVVLGMLIVPFPLGLKIVLIIAAYGIELLCFAYDLFWVQALLERKILKS